MVAVVAAEQILEWVPRGTHEWQLFVEPPELARLMIGSGLQPDPVRC